MYNYNLLRFSGICDECKFLVPTEEEQSITKQNHICLRYDRRRVHHGRIHPNIIRPLCCLEEDGKVYVNG